MLKFYYSGAPNPTKVALFLEEAHLRYEALPVDTRKGDQHKSKFLALNPNAKVPVIVDDGAVVFDSNAILLYLGEKTGQFMPGEPAARYATLQWLMFQMGHIGPMLGQVHHFRNYAPEKLDYAIERYVNEAKRLYGVLDKRLGESPFVVGADYTIADMAIFPWVRRPENQGVEADDYPNYQRWFDEIAARPAVTRGLEVLADRRREGPMTDKAREMMFGATQYQRH